MLTMLGNTLMNDVKVVKVFLFPKGRESIREKGNILLQ